jgi:cytoskeleton protein RodZ
MNFGDDGLRRRSHLREVPGEGETSLDTVGQELHAARLNRGDDLATISRVLKIRKDHLEAVEQDNFTGLPGKAYAIGFVRSYSSYLGLDSAQIVERYKQEISGRHFETLPTDPSLHAEDARYLPYGWRVLSGIILLALVYGVYHLMSGGPMPQPVPPPPSLSPPRAKVAVATPPAPETPVPPPATGDTAVPPPAGNNAAQVAPPAPPKPNSGSLATGSMASAPTSGTAQPNPAVSSVTPAAAQGEVYGRMNLNSHVILRVRNDVRLTVRGPDGTIYLNRDLKAGDSYQVPNLTDLSLATSDAGAVDVMLDGKDLGKVGQDQEILGKVSLNPSSLVDRFNTH